MTNSSKFSSLGELIDDHFENGKNNYKLISLKKKNVLDLEIDNILSLQLNNMFKKKEERRNNEESIENVKNNVSDMLIDFNDCLDVNEISFKNTNDDSNMSLDYIERNEISFKNNEDKDVIMEEIKVMGIEKILKHKLGKPTLFARVLCARYRPSIIYHYHQPPIYPIKTSIKIFDFSTPSTNDVKKSSLRNQKYPTPRILKNKINKKKIIKKINKK